MAITVTKRKDGTTGGDHQSRGNHFAVYGLLTMDNAYVTGGVAVTPALFGLSALFDLQVFSDGVAIPVYDGTAKKVKVYTALNTEASNASDQSARVFRYVATGRGI